MIFRKAVLDDIFDLASLINSAYRGDSARKGWTHEADLVDGLRVTPLELDDIIKSKKEYYLLVLTQDGLSACVHLAESENILEVGMLTVRPDLQGKKIGSALLMEIERLARSSGMKHLRLSVIHVRKELISYYERKGFILTGESEPFPERYPAKLPGLKLLEMKKTL